jgi:hypothetical protein
MSFIVLSAAALIASPAASLALPPGRHYELVSPVFKGGFGATRIGAAGVDGEALAYQSAGVFAEAPGSRLLVGLEPNYLARRGVSGWSTVPLVPPASIEAKQLLSPDLSAQISLGSPVLNRETVDRGHMFIWLHATAAPDTAAAFQPQAELTASAGALGLSAAFAASSDLCHVLAEPDSSLEHPVQPLPEAEGRENPLYEWDRGCGERPPSIALVGVNNKGTIMNRECPFVDPGDRGYAETSSPSLYNAISADGSEVFFTDCLPGVDELGRDRHQLFVRLAGSRTLEVSRPLEPGCVGEGGGPAGEVPCAGASTRASSDFAGASEDGSLVYFTAPRAPGQPPLVPGLLDSSANVYLARIGCPPATPGCAPAEREALSLTTASRDPNNAAAGVLGVVRVAPDGRRVYFVASGNLLSPSQVQALEGEGRPLPHVGADNLYVYDSAADAVTFIGDLCSGTERSGSVEDFHCPSGEADARLWTSGVIDEAGESQTAGPHGEFLVFSTFAQLSGEDDNAARDVYRYDALTGALTRVSHGEHGYLPSGSGGALASRILEGHQGGHPTEQHELDDRAITEDGSRIVFTSAQRLSPLASNGQVNAYEWHEGPGPGGGDVSLVSTGTDPAAVNDVTITPSGRDVFFITSQGLVPQDTDGSDDVYDARLGEGFPAAPAERQPCEGDGCQGPLTNPAPLLVPGSVAASAEGALPPAPTAPAAHAPVPSRAQLLSKALRRCRKDSSRRTRARCTAQARKRYSAQAHGSTHRGQGR